MASAQAQPDIPNVQTQSKESSGTEGGNEPKSGKVFLMHLDFSDQVFFVLFLPYPPDAKSKFLKQIFDLLG